MQNKIRVFLATLLVAASATIASAQVEKAAAKANRAL
jgi:hypothetical protein